MTMKSGVTEQPSPRRLAFFSLGFVRPKLRQRLQSLGFELLPFYTRNADAVTVWGRKPVSRRGFLAAKRAKLPVITIEDGFIRSLKPGWKEAPRSISMDQSGVYFNTKKESDLWRLLLDPPKNHDASLQMSLQAKLGVSKYNHVPRGNWQDSGYILVVDQVKGDQSIEYGQAGEDDFRKALHFAKSEFPKNKILIRTHPAGGGYYHEGNLDSRTAFCPHEANPFDLIEGAKAVIVVTSQMGWDAIIAGKQPHVFGAPFYAGLGLSIDHKAPQRAQLSPGEAYEIIINQYPKYFTQDGALSDALTQIFALHDEMRQSKLAHQPLALKDMRAWKRPHMKRFFPRQTGEQVLRWGQRLHDDEWVVEDGFLRSEGLGAKLVPPLSLIVDKVGIYFDPTRPSDLEALIRARQHLHPLERERVVNLRQKILDHHISKYNLPSEPVSLPNDRPILLVVGQVEDDRSILLGATGTVKTNAQLLAAARRDYPDHFLLYKPHPDVMAGLRKGEIDALQADQIYEGQDISVLWSKVDALATITSLSGFEALMHGKTVACYGMPFYADWGLTQDHAPSTSRRGASSLEALIYASLIDYPLYFDPKTRRLTTVEVIIERIAHHETDYPAYLRAITWLQQKYERLKG